MLVADYRRQAKSAPVEPVSQEGNAKEAGGNPKEAEGGVKEADSSLLELVGRSAFLSQPPKPTAPAKQSSLEAAPIIP
jgi:hypothetical protein